MTDKNQPLVSVIIPIYNVEQYLEKCLDSIINNTYKNLEIICVNDGSPDSSPSILFRYAQKDSRIVVINQENQGVSAARNNGLKAAHGDYISFVDSDDYIHRQFYQTLMNCVQKTGADIVVCDAVKIWPSDDIKEEKHKVIHYKRLDSKQFFRDYYARHMIWGRLYRRELLEGHSFSSEVRKSDDTLFNLEVMRTAENPLVYKTDTPLYYYLQRDNSIVHTVNYLKLKDLSDYYMKYLSMSRCGEDTWGWMLTMQVIKSLLSYRYMIRFRPDVKGLTKEVNKILRVHLREMMSYKGVSSKEKMKHWLMYYCPELYRRFRIHDDPTMLIWEENEIKAQSGMKKQ